MISLPQQSETCRRCYTPGSLGGTMLAAALGAALQLTLSACSSMSMPVLRSRATDAPSSIAAPANGADPTAAQCEQLRSEIRSNHQAVREAPTTSTSPQIVAAAQAKADKRIDDTRERMEELGCATESDSAGAKLRPLAPMPAAPGAATP
jgi:hypothetical protein